MRHNNIQPLFPCKYKGYKNYLYFRRSVFFPLFQQLIELKIKNPDESGFFIKATNSLGY
jgi:hypothetical protein